MISIALILIISLLAALGAFLKKKGATFITLLANEDQQVAALNTVNAFGKACFIFSVVGVAILLFNHVTLALIYISVIMISTAGFTLSLAKKLA